MSTCRCSFRRLRKLFHRHAVRHVLAVDVCERVRESLLARGEIMTRRLPAELRGELEFQSPLVPGREGDLFVYVVQAEQFPPDPDVEPTGYCADDLDRTFYRGAER